MDQWGAGCSVSGRICDIEKVYADYYQYTIDSLKIDDASIEGKMLVNAYYQDFNLNTYTYGDVISFYGSVFLTRSARPEASAAEHAEYVQNRVGYAADTKIYYIDKIGYKRPRLNFLLDYKQKLLNTFYQNMNTQNAQLTTGVLFGSSAQLGTELRSSFNKIGISHILSVSGLHVGFILILLRFIMKKVKAAPIAEFSVSLVILSLYIALTGFAPTVIRASIMALIYLLSILFGKKFDMLTALSISVIIIILISPAEIFDPSFILSVMSILGII
ncbi:MAG TPA: ComEC/Rec2 family competence protein, partial [Clostridia bacterium]|nr:ComEC/Rec2 family competence protein [Clostridia bacterium]